MLQAVRCFQRNANRYIWSCCFVVTLHDMILKYMTMMKEAQSSNSRKLFADSPYKHQSLAFLLEYLMVWGFTTTRTIWCQ